MTVGRPAIHAARALGLDLFVRAVVVDLFPILDALERFAVGDRLPFGI